MPSINDLLDRVESENLKDFPEENLKSHDLSLIEFNDFFADTLDMTRAETIAALRQMRKRFQNPEIDVEE